MDLNNYKTEGFFDELFAADGIPHQNVKELITHLNSLSIKDLKRKQRAAELSLYQHGITFSVYGNKQGTEKIFPFDLIPRVITANEWETLEKGLIQRVHALNLFIHDIYNRKLILKNKVIPSELILQSEGYLKQCIGLIPPKNRWIHISGSDLVRDKSGTFYVLEDNLRCPSGVSYVLENRLVLKRTLPKLFKIMDVRPISNYCDYLYDSLSYLSADTNLSPNIILLTPGSYNSAYYEHAYLAQQMGIHLAESRDLTVINNEVMLRTTKGFEKVDVIYRRIDDSFIDPLEFRKDSLLGVPGIMSCLRKGTVALANAPGVGVADDKAIYPYVPQIIKFYLDEDPILPNVHTYICNNKTDREYVLANLDSLVVKSVNLSGGYGMLIGPHSTFKEREDFREKIKKYPRNYIAQPTLTLSRTPTIINNNIEGRHVDMRPYVIYGESIRVMPGGLTRVALNKGSLVVNSSQGGGSKDTWILNTNKG